MGRLEVPGVAIVGMAGRFPGAKNVADFWQNVRTGVESITFFEPDELDLPPNPDSPDATDVFVPAKGLLDEVDRFDARFFGYLPTEAAVMDPQHRLFLETCWSCLEHAGHDPGRYEGAIGVFAGCYLDTYLLTNLCTDPAFLARLIESIQVGTLQTVLGNDKDYLATRVAYKLDLRGPAITLQTACSTSLVAIVQACNAVLSFQCDMALAGGVTVTLPLRRGYFYHRQGMLSKDGHCRTFDAEASGAVFGNAVAVLLIKRLEDAVADRDTIYAVIRGAATNNDGADKLSYTAPSVQGQADVIALAQALAETDPRSIELIEAHGTATPLGDPIEIQGLTRAFRQGTSDCGYCAIGSVKTNVGHLDVASGVTSVIKTAMALHDRVLPPSLHFERPNPEIDFDRTPFYVNTKLRPWEPSGAWPRRAGVSGFGVGGTNAHVVLEEAPELSRNRSLREAQLLPLSARTEQALEQHSRNLASDLGARAENNLRSCDVALTLQLGRAEMEYRRIIVASNTADALARLALPARGGDQGERPASEPRVVFLFPGQGSQFPNMARDIYRSETVFREHFDACCDLLLPILQLDLRECLFVDQNKQPAAARALEETTLAQPALFAVEYSLAQLWIHWGIYPSLLIGHSVGELTAAALGGVMSVEDTIRLVAERGRLMQACEPGAMLSVRANHQDLAKYLNGAEASALGGLDLAAVNAPQLSVVAGPKAAIGWLQKELQRADIPTQPLHTSHAFHSRLMTSAVAPTVEFAASVERKASQIPIVSTVTGALMEDNEATHSDYWGKNLRSTVRFAGAISQLEGPLVLLEVGPGQTLTTLARQCVATSARSREPGDRGPSESATIEAIPSLGHPGRGAGDSETLMSAAGRLWLLGAPLSWPAFADPAGHRIPLPTYPFERARHWVEPGSQAPAAVQPSLTDSSSLELTEQSAGDRSEPRIERLVEQQLDVIEQQLEVLLAGATQKP